MWTEALQQANREERSICTKEENNMLQVVINEFNLSAPASKELG